MIDVADSNKKYYYHFDGLGSVVALSNSSGNVVERYEYDVFGQPTNASDVNNPYLFTGRRYDDESGLYYYRARYYHASLGRFMQPDPIGYAAGWNIYAYVNNNPVNWIDPHGLWSEADHNRLGRCGGGKFDYAWPDREFNPWKSKANRMRHFGQNRDSLWRAIERFAREGNQRGFEYALHRLQDSYSHEGFGPGLGHLTDPWADSTTRNLAAYFSANRATLRAEKMWDRYNSPSCEPAEPPDSPGPPDSPEPPDSDKDSEAD